MTQTFEVQFRMHRVTGVRVQLEEGKEETQELIWYITTSVTSLCLKHFMVQRAQVWECGKWERGSNFL